MTKKDNTPKQTLINLKEEPDKTREEQISDLMIAGALNAAVITMQYNPQKQVDTNEILSGIHRKAKQVNDGDTKGLESLLVSQAIALDAIFTNLSLKAYDNFGQYLNAGEKYLRLALKAQSQCRATLESLAEIKNPRPYIQNNRAEYQQVNNGAVRNSETNTLTPPHAEKPFSTNELLEDKTHEQEWLDARTPTEAIRSD